MSPYILHALKLTSKIKCPWLKHIFQFPGTYHENISKRSSNNNMNALAPSYKKVTLMWGFHLTAVKYLPRGVDVPRCGFVKVWVYFFLQVFQRWCGKSLYFLIWTRHQHKSVLLPQFISACLLVSPFPFSTLAEEYGTEDMHVEFCMVCDVEGE